MKLIFERNSLFNLIFPSLKSREDIINFFISYFSTDSTTAEVEVDDNFVSVFVSDTHQDDKEFRKAVKLCERNQFDDAKILLTELVEKHPTSEAFRILGQIYSEEGNQDLAIDNLIDALRWNPNNSYALLMMGNIFVKYKNDFPTAKEYFQQALKNNPNDHITISNIGATLLQEGNFSDAEEYLNKAVEIAPYPNALYSLGVVSERKGDFNRAFEYQIEAVKNSNATEQIYKLALDTAYKLSATAATDGNVQFVERFKDELEKRSGVEIKTEGSEEIPFFAKIEFAENYKRDFHLIKFKPSRKAISHLVMHELVHLKLVLDARDINENMLFTSNDANKAKFIKDLDTYSAKLHKLGIEKSKVSNLVNSLFDGFNGLVYNAPLDLFIEDFLFTEFPELRPQQFQSLSAILSEAIYSVTSKEIVDLSPAAILSKTKIYNLVAAYHFKDLFGVDLAKEFKVSKLEEQMAADFYNEFLEYKDDKKPAEEYELLKHWAEDLQADNYFNLVDENQFRNGKDIDSILEDIERDPFSLEQSVDEESQMAKFLASHENSNLNMSVVFYMIEALNFFKDKSTEKTKEIAFEIAMQGRQGYNPNGETYRLATVPNKTFSGYQILAYYYVSWALAIPEMLAQLQLPFDEEWKLANNLK